MTNTNPMMAFIKKSNIPSTIKDKLKKLKRLASSSNEHEASLAMDRAKEIALKHGIDLALVEAVLYEVIGDLPPQHTQPSAHVEYAKDEKVKIMEDGLATVLILEAGGEGQQGMQAVMNVIQNRAKGSKNLVDLMKIVIKPLQFSSLNGTKTIQDLQVKIEKSRKHPKFNEAKQIVQTALQGKLKDITGGSDHYYASNGANAISEPTWGKNLKHTVNIGKHSFMASLNENAYAIHDKIKFLEMLLDANEKFHAITEGDGKNYVNRVSRFEKKWNRAPLRLKEVNSIKKEIDSLKRKKFSILKGNKRD